ncbi:thialysine N-epsilon-acetyltransferase-like [Hemicordylus capensis]|uniref:thialysine N-epsilon-acetyltransferase-like n=1 Tax=Hemicordylus capensis TaxID=884348 RepID=UPI00230459CD|nr:thialysine N-epsilon-acetyltransferase-like [Hemicordylus capensis]
MSYIIRPWATKDLKDIMRLIKECAAFHKALDQVKTDPEMLRKDGFGKEATFGCLVAEVPPGQKSKEGHTIIGYQFHYLTYCTWDGPVLFGEDLYVVPDFRGKGVGTSLMNKVAKVALEKGCSQFRFISASWNQPAMDFYSKLGALNVTSTDHWNLIHLDSEHIRKLVEQPQK